MQVGDPKKTVILGVVAVGAIGFLVMRLMGGGDGPRVTRQAPDPSAVNAPQSTGQIVAINLEPLRGDAFSHPHLAPKTGLVGQPDPSTGGTSTAGTFVQPGEDPKWPDPFQQPGDAGGISTVRPETWPDPVSPGSKPGGDVKVEKLTQVTLRAIVKVSQRMAYLSVDGQEARGFRAGDLIKDDLQVVIVNDDSVIVKTSKRTMTLKVGQQGDL